MCEFNRPYFVPYGCHPDDRYSMPERRVLPFSALQQRLGELAQDQVVVIEQAIEEAAAIPADVHLYRSPNSPYLGIAFREATSTVVRVWEH